MTGSVKCENKASYLTRAVRNYVNARGSTLSISGLELELESKLLTTSYNMELPSVTWQYYRGGSRGELVAPLWRCCRMEAVDI